MVGMEPTAKLFPSGLPCPGSQWGEGWVSHYNHNVIFIFLFIFKTHEQKKKKEKKSGYKQSLTRASWGGIMVSLPAGTMGPEKTCEPWSAFPPMELLKQ